MNVLQVGWGGGVVGSARETSIKVSPYGTLFQCCKRSSGRVQRCLRAIGPLVGELQVGGWGDLQGKRSSWFLLMEHCFVVVQGIQARFDEVFYLSVHYCTSVRLGRWRGCASCCCIWWLLAKFHP